MKKGSLVNCYLVTYPKVDCCKRPLLNDIHVQFIIRQHGGTNCLIIDGLKEMITREPKS